MIIVLRCLPQFFPNNLANAEKSTMKKLFYVKIGGGAIYID